MRTLRQLFAAFMLACLLTLSAFAGQIDTGFTNNPPPPGSQAATTGDMTTGVTGDMPTGITTPDTVTDIALNLLQSLLPLF